MINEEIVHNFIQITESNTILIPNLDIYHNIPTVKFKPKHINKCSCDYFTGTCLDGNCENGGIAHECVSGENACTTKCQNTRFQDKRYKKLEIRECGKKGRGAFAGEHINNGEFIIEYCGEIVDGKEMILRLSNGNANHYYMFSLGKGMYVDASRKGNVSRYLNHSCDPNVRTEIWHVGKQQRIGMFAVRDIPIGEELCFDYAFENYGDPVPCFCGASNCRKFLQKKTKFKPNDPKQSEHNQNNMLKKSVTFAKHQSDMIESLRGEFEPDWDFLSGRVWSLFLLRNLRVLRRGRIETNENGLKDAKSRGRKKKKKPIVPKKVSIPTSCPLQRTLEESGMTKKEYFQEMGRIAKIRATMVLQKPIAKAKAKKQMKKHIEDTKKIDISPAPLSQVTEHEIPEHELWGLSKREYDKKMKALENTEKPTKNRKVTKRKSDLGVSTESRKKTKLDDDQDLNELIQEEEEDRIQEDEDSFIANFSPATKKAFGSIEGDDNDEKSREAVTFILHDMSLVAEKTKTNGNGLDVQKNLDNYQLLMGIQETKQNEIDVLGFVAQENESTSAESLVELAFKATPKKNARSGSLTPTGRKGSLIL